MTVWGIRVQNHDELEPLARSQGLIAIGWGQLGDLSTLTSREELYDWLRRDDPSSPDTTVYARGEYIWRFRTDVTVDDLVILRGKQRTVAIGTVKEPYRFRTDLGVHARHVIQVTWLETSLPFDRLPDDLRASFFNPKVVFRVGRDRSTGQRILALLDR